MSRGAASFFPCCWGSSQSLLVSSLGPEGTALGHLPSLGEPGTTGLGLLMPLGGGQGDTWLYNRAGPYVVFPGQTTPHPHTLCCSVSLRYLGNSI